MRARTVMSVTELFPSLGMELELLINISCSFFFSRNLFFSIFYLLDICKTPNYHNFRGVKKQIVLRFDLT